jgi:hypothetical protein
MTQRFLIALVLVGAASAGGCARRHLSHNYGQAYHAWFQAQHVNSNPSPEKTRRYIEGLDATEAALVSKNYRRTAAGKTGAEEAAAGGRLLMIGPQRTSDGGYVPPPSVPGGQ